MSVFKTRASAALLGTATVLLAATPVGAQNFFEALFGPPRAPAYLPAPFFRPFGTPPQRRKVVSRPAELKHEAAPVPQMPKEAKPARVTPDAELVSSLLGDPTLRKGDIVVFPDGPRVFKGNGTFASHTMGDFEDLRASRSVGDGTRSEVLAATRSSPSARSSEPKIATVSTGSKSRRGRNGSREDVASTGALPVSVTQP
jgi:hypothetical protein